MFDVNLPILHSQIEPISTIPESVFNEFEKRLKSTKNRFQLNAGLNLKTLNTILSGTNPI